MTEDPKISAAQALAAIEAGQAIVCYSKCYSCMFGLCPSPRRWHSWADDEDIAHAAEHGLPDPSDSRCGCSCADVERGGSETGGGHHDPSGSDRG